MAMLADFPSVNLAESFAVWQAKKSPSAVLLGRGEETEVRLFRWQQDKKFTVLEDFVLKALERQLGCSDEEIARVLCLEPEDIDAIVGDGMLKEEIDGDSSRRTLPDDFTRRAPDAVALAVAGKTPPPEIEGGESARAGVLELLNTFGRGAGRDNQSKKRKEWMQESGARQLVLPVSAFRYNDGEWVFLCGGEVVPPVLNGPLSKLKAFQGIGEKAAPSGAVCHRDEFWPWLKHCLGEKETKQVVFECARGGEAAREWLRAETGVVAELRAPEEHGGEAVCLDDERFELRGNFIRDAGRAK